MFTQPYTGAERCQPCHADAYTTWSGSKHAHAFDILVKSSQNFNPKCVGCHTMGYGKPQGFVSAIATPEIRSRFRHFVNSDAPDRSVIFVAERGQIRPARPDEREDELLTA